MENTFGELIRRLRLAQGLTQKDLARRASLDQSHTNRIERGIRKPPKRDKVVLLARALGLNYEQECALLQAAGYAIRSVEDIATGAAVGAAASSGMTFPMFGLTKDLLQQDIVIRDPLHGDIALSRLERQIIDATEFQRLRYIKQSETANLVYPSAVHTRFEHSLGTLEVAQQMVNLINSNPLAERKVSEEANLLIRLAALLHDIGHVPFQHALESQANLFSLRDSKERYLDPASEIGKILGVELSAQVSEIICAETDEAIRRARYPFAIDIVQQNICADLMDYMARDAYFAGLKDTYDPRFFRYLEIAGQEPGVDRLVIRLYAEGYKRLDVLSAILDLLRLKYSLAEKVYFHHTNQVASAMVGRAVQYAQIDRDILYHMGDDQLILRLEASEVYGARYISKRLRERRLFRPVYRVGYLAANLEYGAIPVIRALYSNPNIRATTEDKIAGDCGLPPETIIIACQNPSVSLKETDCLVSWVDDRISRLREVESDPPRSDVEHLIKKYSSLWNFYVLVASDVDEQEAREVADACQFEFRSINELPEYRWRGSGRKSKPVN